MGWSEMLTCIVGIMAYNEEANIGRLLDALLRQRLFSCVIKEIWVVASGCEDRTEEIVRDYHRRDGRINLLVQKRREGKASAINLFLSRTKGEIIILESGDTIPETDAIEKLVSPFLSDQEVGMTGGHPVPVGSPDTFMGFTVSLLWRLHHRISLDSPKMGEFVAFRNIVKEIPVNTPVDEASIEAIITEAGYKLKYAGDAVVYNKGPENVRDFIKQRRRIAAGHLYVRLNQGYTVSTTSWKHIMIPLLKEMKWGGREILWTLGAVSLEILGRALGYYDFYVRKRNPFIWDIAATTKDLKRVSR